MEVTNRFNKGLNKDINKINYPNDTYYHLQNGRILSDTGNDNFSISNITGNELEINNLYPDFTIIGYVNVRNDIVLFYANKDNTGEGKIILLKQINESFIDFVLYANSNLGFYSSYPILEDMVVSRYESPEIIKIYWTDNHNDLRFLNIAPDIGLPGNVQSNYTTVNATALDKLDLVSEVNFTEPVFNSFTSGSLNSGMVQYAYRLYNLNGGETVFSPASELIPLTKYSDTNGTQKLKGQSTGGQSTDTNTGKGVTIKILLDTTIVNSFDKIEVVSMWFSDRNGIPTISIIDRKDVNETVYITDEGGTAEYGTIEVETYQAISNTFTCETLVSKDSRLYAGNITENYFDIDYDARAYRRTSLTYGNLYSKGGQERLLATATPDSWELYTLTSGDPYTGRYTAQGTFYSTTNIPEDFDCVNITNILDYESIYAPLVYKINGTDLGGEGVNISYEFAITSYIVSINSQTANEILELDTSIGDNRDWIYGSKKGFQRDEIYRFGIVFFDSKGRSSFTKWIGDIRMPSNSDYPITEDYGTSTLFIQANALNPVFTVTNIPIVNGKALDYEIVYVKRNYEDKTIISQGIGGALISDASHDYYFSSTIVPPIEDYVDATSAHGGNEVSKTLFEFISPDINFDKTFTIPLYKLEAIGAVKSIGHSHRGDSWSAMTYRTDYSGDLAYDDDIVDINKYSAILPFDETVSTNITDSYVLIPSPETTGKVTMSSGDIVSHYCLRNDFNCHGGMKGTSAVIEVDSEFSTSTYFGTGVDKDKSVFLFNIKNNIIGYNGNTYSDRATNTYIPASKLNNGTCYNGDTFICMYDYLRVLRDDSRGSNEKLTQVIYFPLETQFNLNYRYDDSFSRINNYNGGVSANEYAWNITETGYTDLSVGIDWSDLYLYDSVYSKIDESKTYLPNPSDFSSNKIFDCMIKYSDLKLNDEERDSWLSFKTNNFNEVDSNYGALKSLINFNDTIFCFQESGISVASINRQELVSSDVGVNLVLGTGGLLDRFDYISTEIGIQGLNKVIVSLQALYWLDINKKKIYKYSRGIESMDDLKGLNSWFEYGLSNMSVLKGIYDNEHSEVLMTIINLEPTEQIVEYVTLPSSTIRFSSIVVGSTITLSLNNSKYIFTASTNPTTGQFFKVITGDTLGTVNELITAIRNFASTTNYDLTTTGSNPDPIYLTIDGLTSDLGNINPKVVAASISGATPSGGTSGGVGVTLQDYSNSILNPDTIFYVDCDAYGVPDKFEILVDGTTVGPTNVVASSHISDATVLNGANTNFDPNSDYTTPTSGREEWYIGTSNGTAITGIAEFEAATNMVVPLTSGYQQRIWTTVSPGDIVTLRISGTRGTAWRVSAGTMATAIGNINVDSIVNIEKSQEIFTTYKRTSMLEATGNGNLLQVVNPEYFDLRTNNKYSINDIDNTTITAVDSTQFTTDKTFTGDIDLSSYAKYNDLFTVAYNEATQSFTGFYDFIPDLYIKFKKGFFTSIDNQQLWRHNKGTYCKFYNKLYDTYIDIVVASNSTSIKEFNNFSFYSEVYKYNQIVANETVYSIQVENDYQQSEEVILYPMSDDTDLKAGSTRHRLYTEGNNIPIISTDFNNLANIRRVIDHWRTATPRVITIDPNSVQGDYSATDYTDEDYYLFAELTGAGINTYDRIRSPYCKIRLKYKNEEDKKFILHQINTIFQPMIV